MLTENLKKISTLVLIGGSLLMGADAMAAKLVCSSHKNAPAYLHSSGQWQVSADIQSVWTLKDLKLSNKRHRNLGSETPRTQYDRRISDSRLFKLKPDVFCNYEFILPKDFISEKSFTASLEMTCDDMYDGRATLYCVVK